MTDDYDGPYPAVNPTRAEIMEAIFVMLKDVYLDMDRWRGYDRKTRAVLSAFLARPGQLFD
jgi:hypothetical protein